MSTARCVPRVAVLRTAGPPQADDRPAPVLSGAGAGAGAGERSGPAAGVPEPAPEPALVSRLDAHTPLHVVANAGSGSQGLQEVERLRTHPLCSSHVLRLHPLQPGADVEGVVRQAARCARADGGVLLALGGDGTANAVAQRAVAEGLAFGLLPRGTFNFFARDQGLSQDPEQAMAALLQALREGAVRRLPVAEVNGRVFLVNASVGLYPRLLAERERVTRRWGRHRLVALAAAVATLMRPGRLRHHRLRLHLADGRQTRQEVAVSTFFVGASGLQFSQLGLPGAEALDRGHLGVVTLAAQSRWETVRLLGRALLRQLDADPAVQTRVCEAVELDEVGTSRRPIVVAFDGERQLMTLPLRFGLAARPLYLIAAPTAPTAPTVPADPPRPDTAAPSA
ncbi:MAG: hypothetical protein RIQ53_3153 [Pseudomonadota bacterium]